MSQNKPGFLRDPIWTFVGVLIALAALLFAVFTWVVPNIYHSDNSTPTPSISPTPIIVVSRTPTANSTSSPTNAPTTSNNNKPLTCISGTLCNSYSMNILITNVEIGSGNSTWSFQITNNGSQSIGAYLYAYIDFDEFHVYAGELHLNPNETQQIPVTFSAYAPGNNSSQNPKLKFEILPSASSVVYYSQTCTYLASLNTCQS